MSAFNQEKISELALNIAVAATEEVLSNIPLVGVFIELAVDAIDPDENILDVVREVVDESQSKAKREELHNIITELHRDMRETKQLYRNNLKEYLEKCNDIRLEVNVTSFFVLKESQNFDEFSENIPVSNKVDYLHSTIDLFGEFSLLYLGLISEMISICGELSQSDSEESDGNYAARLESYRGLLRENYATFRTYAEKSIEKIVDDRKSKVTSVVCNSLNAPFNFIGFFSTYLCAYYDAARDSNNQIVHYETTSSGDRDEATDRLNSKRELYIVQVAADAYVEAKRKLPIVDMSLEYGMSRSIALKASHGKYVCAEKAGLEELIANRDAIGIWEQFDLIKLGDREFCLRACNGKYVCAEQAGSMPLIANRKQAGTWETFKLLELGGNRIRLIACNGKHVASFSNQSPLISDVDEDSRWGGFTLIEQ